METRKVIPGVILAVALAGGGCGRDASLQSSLMAKPKAEETPAGEPEEGVVPARRPEVRYVYLEYRPAAEDGCIRVHDERTSIWLDHPPSRVEWQSLDGGEELRWVIEYDEAKGGDPVLPGRMVIPCSKTSAYRSPRPNTTSGARWTYKVSVFRCTGGRAEPEPACVVDPEVIIWK